MKNIAINYYQNLFSTSHTFVQDELLDAIEARVSEPMNALLIREFQAMEVRKALKQMHLLKAPGLDDMNPLFYQHFWPIVGDCVTKCVLDFLNLGVTPVNFNETHIIVIPKVKSPMKISKYRPISLSNVVSRNATKVLANRVKVVLPSIISENQSAFMANRLITDIILVAFEVKNHISQKRGGRVGKMALKFDMSKAYDQVELGGLEQIMLRMGFHSKWVNTVMHCHTSVTYSIRINGAPHGHIALTRGLRSGDPLSPYLFLLCAEGLSSLIWIAAVEEKITGISICCRGPQLSHVLCG